MSGSSAGVPEELHILAGEYVLGVLDQDEMRAVRRRAALDPALGAAVTGWERRLAPLAGIVTPMPPPPALWSRLERAIAELPDEAAAEMRDPVRTDRDVASSRLPEARSSEAELRPLPTLPRPIDPMVPLVPRQRAARSGRRVWPWQLATIGSLALAAAVAAVAFVPSVALRLHLGPAPGQFAALTSADGPAPGFLAQTQPDGTVMLTALATVAVPSGHDLELWMLRPGASVPASLGVLPPGGRHVTLGALPPDGTQLMVSLEPPGGSPTGLPTGPVLYKGALAQLSL